MSTIKLPKEYMIEEVLFGDVIVHNEIVENTRWSIIHEIVFKHEGKFYRAFYSVGATEQQDESPWEYEDEVECTEVVEKEVLVKQWVDV